VIRVFQTLEGLESSKGIVSTLKRLFIIRTTEDSKPWYGWPYYLAIALLWKMTSPSYDAALILNTFFLGIAAICDWLITLRVTKGNRNAASSGTLFFSPHARHTGLEPRVQSHDVSCRGNRRGDNSTPLLRSFRLCCLMLACGDSRRAGRDHETHLGVLLGSRLLVSAVHNQAGATVPPESPGRIGIRFGVSPRACLRSSQPGEPSPSPKELDFIGAKREHAGPSAGFHRTVLHSSPFSFILESKN